LGSGLIACYRRQRQEKFCLGTVNGWDTDVWERFVTTNDACCVVNDPSADFPKPGRVWKGMSCTGWRNHSSCREKQTARSTRRDGCAGCGGLSSPRGSAATLAFITVGFGPVAVAIGLLVPVRRVATLFDPCVTREGLSVIPLGRRTNLNGKPGGESSMFETAGDGETADPSVCLGPDGMVKARLLEPQWPNSKVVCPDTAEIPQSAGKAVGGRGLKTSPVPLNFDNSKRGNPGSPRNSLIRREGTQMKWHSVCHFHTLRETRPQ
jgi:hypothetical protein